MAGIEIKLRIKEILRTDHNGGNYDNLWIFICACLIVLN